MLSSSEVGFSGLAVAASLALDGQAGETCGVTLLEGSDRVGGVTWSDVEDGRVLDRGPSSWLSGEPALDRLIALAGLEDQIMPASPASRARFIWADGALHAVPMAPPALLSTKLLTWSTRLRMLAEPLVSRGDSEADETVAAFAARRLGPGVVPRLVAPMVAGIYGADPDQLSLRAAFPKMWELERTVPQPGHRHDEESTHRTAIGDAGDARRLRHPHPRVGRATGRNGCTWHRRYGP